MEKFNIQGVQTLRGNKTRGEQSLGKHAIRAYGHDTIYLLHIKTILFMNFNLHLFFFDTSLYVIEKIISNNWLTRNPRYITIVTIVIYNVVITMCLLYTDYIHIHDKQECNAPCFLTGMSCEKLVFLCSHPLRGLQDSVYY